MNIFEKITANFYGGYPFRIADQAINNDQQVDTISQSDMPINFDGIEVNMPQQNEYENNQPGEHNQFASHYRPSTNINIPPSVLEIIQADIGQPPPVLSEPVNMENPFVNKPQSFNSHLQNMVNNPLTETTETSTEQTMNNFEKPVQSSVNTMDNIPKPSQKPNQNGNGNGLNNEPDSKKPINHAYFYSTAPMFQTAYYSQYNSFIPYSPQSFGQQIPFNQNAFNSKDSGSQLLQRLTNSGRTREKPNVTKNIYFVV